MNSSFESLRGLLGNVSEHKQHHQTPDTQQAGEE